MTLVASYVIRIYVPLLRDTPTDRSAPPNDPYGKPNGYVEKLINLIVTSEVVGRLGNYAGVYELSRGEEAYIPLEGSNPTEGSQGIATRGKAAIITTYAVNVDWPVILEFVRRVAECHPWEHPVIECFGPGGPKVWMP